MLFFFSSLSLYSYSQESFEHHKFRSNSLEIFKNEKGIHHVFNHNYHTHLRKFKFNSAVNHTKELSHERRKVYKICDMVNALIYSISFKSMPRCRLS